MREELTSNLNLDGAKLPNGDDLGVEIQKLRAGALTNDILARMQLKGDCAGNPNATYCGWANRLRYYAYSAVSLFSIGTDIRNKYASHSLSSAAREIVSL